MCINDNRGFTLIEVLVTGMILSVLVSLSFFAMTLYLNELKYARLSDTSAIQEFRRQRLLQAAVESAWEYFITDPANERIGKYYPYFKGTSDSIAFITTSPVFAKNSTAAVRIRLIDDKGETGSKVVYEEASLDKYYIRYYKDEIKYHHTLNVSLPEKDLRFRFYGFWERRFLPGDEFGEEVLRWQGNFDGRDRQAVPEIIEIVMQSDSEEALYSFVVKARNKSKGAFYFRD